VHNGLSHGKECSCLLVLIESKLSESAMVVSFQATICFDIDDHYETISTPLRYTANK
jgi:hypothetical protein